MFGRKWVENGSDLDEIVRCCRVRMVEWALAGADRGME
jgi:hypothetical protein